jgi:2-polyprenyl-3-methyl-5-hydroxy-6-metoxy-1,4-benzoquinol methylase
MVLVASDQWMFQSESKWDKEWKSGDWTYMETIAVERSRIAVIGGVFVPMFTSSNASVLDIGCGEGAISDFLTTAQQTSYVGLDISKEAILVAKHKRGPPRKFVHANLYDFKPLQKFDAIIFSDVLYYVEYEKVLKQYAEYLKPGGIFIISIFHQTEKLMYENIWGFARSTYTLIDEIDVGGYTRKGKSANKEKTAFHIEVYRKK